MKRTNGANPANNPHTTFNAPFSASVFYCPACDVPVVTPTSQINEVTGKGDCPLCGGATKYLATDLRPVFPEERFLLELLLEAEPFSLAESVDFNGAYRLGYDRMGCWCCPNNNQLQDKSLPRT